MRFFLLLALAVLFAPLSIRAGDYFQVEYPPSDQPGELIFGVKYELWVPKTSTPLRGIIVHQHGCGEGACKGGLTAARDVHWQALARKWNCALLAPSFKQKDGQDCRKWCDPRNGSAKRFLQAIDELADKSKHPELKKAPWCLWGHSGGAFWASLMQTIYPERILAIWFRSGTAFSAWEKGEIAKPELPQAMFDIPMMLNPGSKEQGDKRFGGLWTASQKMQEAYRKQNGRIAFAADPFSNHDCGSSRYLAIAWFDSCLSLRLPEKAGEPMKPLAMTAGVIHPEAGWLPSKEMVIPWQEYTRKGTIPDTTAPSRPRVTRVVKDAKGQTVVHFDLEADLESGIAEIILLRDGKEVARLPQRPIDKYRVKSFYPISYHDTPEQPPVLEIVDASEGAGTGEYSLHAVNGVGLKSR